MKISFSLPSKSSSKPVVNSVSVREDTAYEGTRKEYVTEFDPTKSLADSKPKYIIPPKENEWRPYKRMKNLDIPLQSNGTTDSSLQFEVVSDTATDDSMSYGLNVRQGQKNENGLGTGSRRVPVEQSMLQSLKHDLARLPEDRGFEEFEEVPVEGFGAALLSGYGWREGRGIGKNAKEDVKVKEYNKWTGREGLGFDPKDRLPDPMSEGEVKEKKVDQAKDVFSIGKDVRIIAGRDSGSKARIVEKLSRDRFLLKLSKTAEDVKLRADEIAELGSREEEKCLKRLKELKIREDKQSDRRDGDKQESRRNRATERDRGSASEFRAREKKGREEGKKKEEVPWLRNHIRVRVITKDLKGGKLYLKKGAVVDMVSPTICDVTMDETRELVQGIGQEHLETALPRRGGPVLVLYGRHKGVYGCLMEKDLDKETGLVRDADNHELHKVKLDQIAEYVGDPGDIGY